MESIIIMKYFTKKIPTLIAILATLALALLAPLSGCANASDAVSQDKLTVTATTTMLGDLVKNISGDAVSVRTLMGPGLDPHTYQASAGDVTLMQEADIVVYNGLHLEGKMGDVFSALSESGRDIICIADGLDETRLLSSEEAGGTVDPHIWFDVSIWTDAAAYLADRLSQIDPDHADQYNENLQTYTAELEDLDAYIRQRTEELTPAQRVLITAHDAFRYFGAAYGYEVQGLQGISTSAEAGTADVSHLAAFIAEHSIGAIFLETSVPTKSIEALQAATEACGFSVDIGGTLYSDSLGDAASGCDTYISTFKANIDTIVDGLKGGGTDD